MRNLLQGPNDCNFFGIDLVGVDPLLDRCRTTEA
jgi:hypothetical protein